MDVRMIPPYASDERFEEIGIKKYCFNVDSRFRKNYLTPTTNYQHHLQSEVKNVVAVNITSIEMPNTYSIISAANRTNQFHITYLGDLITMTISDGNYNATQLFTSIEKALTDSGKGDWDLSLNVITGKVTLTELNGIPFGLYFDRENYFTKRACDFGLGAILGFQKKEYTGFSSYTGESFINLYGDPYLLLRVNDYDVVFTRNRERETIGATAKIILNRPKLQYVFDNANFITKRYVFYQPKNISKLDVLVTNPYGEILDFGGANWSFTIEMEVVENSHLYEQYRLHRLS